MTKQLAFENAKSTCQAILCPIRRSGGLIHYIRQCADVGLSMLQGVAIAAAIKGNSYQQAVQSFFTNKNKPQQGDPRSQGENYLPRTCFSCGQERHIFYACLQRTLGSYPPKPAPPAVSALQNPVPPAVNPTGAWLASAPLSPSLWIPRVSGRPSLLLSRPRGGTASS